MFPSGAVKYLVELLAADGAVLDKVGFAAKGATDKEFSEEYVAEGNNRVLEFLTDQVSAQQMHISAFDNAGAYLGSGCVNDLQLAAGKESVFDNAKDASQGGFDFMSADDEAEACTLEVKASETYLGVGETASLTVICRNETNGLSEDVTSECEFSADSECVSLKGRQVTGEEIGTATVTATLALNEKVSLSGEVQINVDGDGRGMATVVVVDAEKYKDAAKYIVKFVDETCHVMQRDKFAAKASGEWKASAKNAPPKALYRQSLGRMEGL